MTDERRRSRGVSDRSLDPGPSGDELQPLGQGGGRASDQDDTASETQVLVSELGDRQVRFAKNVVAFGDRNQTRAAVQAGYSPRTARQQASRLRRHPKVGRLIELLPQEAGILNEVVPQDVLVLMVDILRASVFDFLTIREDGTVKLRKVSDIPQYALNAAKRVVVKGDGSITVERHDKLKVIDMLGRRMGLFTPARVPPLEEPGRSPVQGKVEKTPVRLSPYDVRVRSYGPEFLEMARRMRIHGRSGDKDPDPAEQHEIWNGEDHE